MSICDISDFLLRGERLSVHRFQVVPEVHALPSPVSLNAQLRDTPAYHFRGKGRTEYNYCVFQYTLSGTGIFEAHGVQQPVGPGRGFLVNVQDPEYQYYYPPRGKEPWCFLYLQMTGGATHMMVSEMVRRFGYVYDLRPDHPLLDAWADLLQHPSPGVLSPHEASSIVHRLLEALLESASGSESTTPGIPLIRSAMERLDQAPRHPWNASTLANELRVSREHLSRLFKEHTGRSAYDYIRDYRIRSAANELRQNTASIKEVSDLYGFTSPSTFSKAFKQVFGVSPRGWLNQGLRPANIRANVPHDTSPVQRTGRHNPQTPTGL